MAAILPISVPTSQKFQGFDGIWSTFLINVGETPQTFNVLISTSSEETWVPSSGGCNSTIEICGEKRGVQAFNNKPSRGFQTNESTTWVDDGTFELGLERNLNYTGTGNYGHDTVGIGLPSGNGTRLTQQIVAAVTSNDFYFGQLGLAPKLNHPSNSSNTGGNFLQSLKTNLHIPSLSFGYTAGAPYKVKKTLGSLTLGGYDSSLFEPNSIKFPFGPDKSRSLVLGIQSISAINTLKTRNETLLLSSEITSLIDSSVPDIWLPEAACENFAEAFALLFDASSQRYLVNESIHTELLSRNPIVTFNLVNSVAEKAIQIVLPYLAFDLQAGYPIYPNVTRFFPLRRASNESQFTLGRVFLQEAYIIVDYERSQFSVSQTILKNDNPSKIVAIRTVDFTEPKIPVPWNTIAIILAALAGVMLLSTSLLLILRSRRRGRLRAMGLLAAAKTSESNVSSKKGPREIVIGHPIELRGASGRHEMGAGPSYELPGRNVLIEMPSRYM